MGEALIPRRNNISGSSNKFAAIGVIYSEGSICTCRNSTNVEMQCGYYTTIEGQDFDQIGYIYPTNNIACIPGNTYTIKVPSLPFNGTVQHNIYFYDQDDLILLEGICWGLEDNSVTFTVPDGVVAFSFDIDVNNFGLTEEEKISLLTDVILIYGEIEKVFIAPNTSGQVVFNIPEEGTWIVSCANDSGQSVSKYVLIEAAGDYSLVYLCYPAYLIQNGELIGTWVTSTYAATPSVITDSDTEEAKVKFTMKNSSSSCSQTGHTAIDVSAYANKGYTALYVDGYGTSSSGWSLNSTVNVSTTATGGVNAAKLTMPKTDRVVSVIDIDGIDLSEVSFVRVGTSCGCDTNRGFSAAYIYNLYFM